MEGVDRRKLSYRVLYRRQLRGYVCEIPKNTIEFRISIIKHYAVPSHIHVERKSYRVSVGEDGANEI